MPDIETLDVFTINFNTRDTQTQNELIYIKVKDEQSFTKNAKNRHNWHSILNNKGNPTVIDDINSNLNYFIPGPQQEAEKRASTEITKIT